MRNDPCVAYTFYFASCCLVIGQAVFFYALFVYPLSIGPSPFNVEYWVETCRSGGVIALLIHAGAYSLVVATLYALVKFPISITFLPSGIRYAALFVRNKFVQWKDISLMELEANKYNQNHVNINVRLANCSTLHIGVPRDRRLKIVLCFYNNRHPGMQA